MYGMDSLQYELPGEPQRILRTFITRSTHYKCHGEARERHRAHDAKIGSGPLGHGKAHEDQSRAIAVLDRHAGQRDLCRLEEVGHVGLTKGERRDPDLPVSLSLTRGPASLSGAPGWQTRATDSRLSLVAARSARETCPG